MEQVITSILTDTGARDHLKVEKILIEQANVAAPWADLTEEK